ncbi:MAG TPA: nuclear transport factor 2 family protein, partial [Steroidobacteraceae bacterium]|nr:nuclear transport factor 2 family protein [Steroidobacteraceae bacterium]
IKLVAFSDREAALKTLVAANDELDAAMITEGPRVLEERMEPGARVYREGVAPLERTSAIEVALAQAPSRIAAQRIGSDVSEAGDLGYTIGYGRTVTQGSPQDLVYVRIWRRSEGVWRVLLDLETPLPAAGDS